MNEDFRNSSIDPELQVRLLNLVMGEASDFERDQLQAMMEQRPELAAYLQHLQHLHGLLQEVGLGEFPLKSDFASGSDSEDFSCDTSESAAEHSESKSESVAWKMSAERREMLLAVLNDASEGSVDSATSSPAISASNSASQTDVNRSTNTGPSTVRHQIVWWQRSARRLAELAAVSACLLLGCFLILPSMMHSARDAAAAVGLSRKFSASQYGLASDDVGEKAYTVVVPQAGRAGEPARYYLKNDVRFGSGTVETFTVPVGPIEAKGIAVLPSKPAQQLDALRASTSSERFGASTLGDVDGVNEQLVGQNALLGDGEIRGRSSSVEDFEQKPSGEIASQPSRQLGRTSETEVLKERFRTADAGGSSTQAWDTAKAPSEQQSAASEFLLGIAPKSELGSQLDSVARAKQKSSGDGAESTLKALKEERFDDAIVEVDRTAVPLTEPSSEKLARGWQELSRNRVEAESKLVTGGDALDGKQNQPAKVKISDPPVATPMFDAPQSLGLEDKLADMQKSIVKPEAEFDFGISLIEGKELEASERRIKLPSSLSDMPATGEPSRVEVRRDSEFARSTGNTAELSSVGDRSGNTVLGINPNTPVPADVFFDKPGTIAAAPFGGVAGVPKPQPTAEGRPDHAAGEFEGRIQDKNPAKSIEEARISGDANVRLFNESATNVEVFLGRKSVAPAPARTEEYWSFQGQAAGKELKPDRSDWFSTEGSASPSKKNSLATGAEPARRDEHSLGEQASRLDSSLMLSVTPRIVVLEAEEEKLGKAVRPSVELGFVPQDEAKQELLELQAQKLAESKDYDEAIKQAQPVPFFRFINPADQSVDSAAGLNLFMYRENSNWFENRFSKEEVRGEPGVVSANRGTIQLGGITRGREGKDVIRESLAPSPELASKTRDFGVDDSGKGYIEPKLNSSEAPKPAPASLMEESAKDNSYSTFSLHVSDVSFKLAASALAQQQLPDASSIRVEEFVNAMDYRDPLPNNDEKVACAIEQSIHPALMQRNLLRISMRTAALGRSKNTPLRLTILLDNSGSMERADRRQAIQRAFQTLTQQLNEKDQITLISFANSPRLLADKMSGSQGELLLQLVENMPSEGGTNIEAALRLAREKALEQKLDSAQNRIVLMTDGAVNLGDANPANLSKMVTELRDSGIAFDAAGICAQDLNDEVLEALTRQGDGRYYLLDAPQSIDAAFAAQIAGALRPTAQNVKVQVEFNPSRVGKYKLLGFEKHRLNQEDFRNDKVDAAELSAAEAGVAVYQIEPLQNGSGDIGSVSVRFRDVATGRMIERRWPIAYEDNPARIDSASPTMKLAAAASLLAVKLKLDPLAQNVDLAELSQWVAKLPEPFSSHPRTQQLQTMIEQLRQISR